MAIEAGQTIYVSIGNDPELYQMEVTKVNSRSFYALSKGFPNKGRKTEFRFNRNTMTSLSIVVPHKVYTLKGENESGEDSLMEDKTLYSRGNYHLIEENDELLVVHSDYFSQESAVVFVLAETRSDWSRGMLIDCAKEAIDLFNQGKFYPESI